MSFMLLLVLSVILYIPLFVTVSIHALPSPSS